MKLAPSRYAAKAQPILAKKKLAAKIKHLQAPLSGLSVSSRMSVGDTLTASILDNWVVEKDRCTVRPGLRYVLQLANAPIVTLVPYHGQPNTLALAQSGSLFDTSGALIRSGFTSDNWNWTSFSNLGVDDYSVMVNGRDGVWSWDGTNTQPGASVTVTSLSNANPAVVTVAAGDISKFANGMRVTIAGADAAHAAANGTWTIYSVGTPANTFTIPVSTASAPGPQTSGVTARPAGSMVLEPVTAPTAKPYINPLTFHTVLSHMNRLWFADQTNLAVYYLPLQSKSGELKELPLNALFRRGGFIRAIYTWTLDGGAGTEDQLVIFSSNGEAVIYGGTDPDTDFALTGIFRFDSPLSMKSIMNYGGDLYVLIGTGLVPMSTMLRAESEQLGTSDKNVVDMFTELTRDKADLPGFQVLLDYNRGWAICNIPTGAPNVYRQMVRFMPDPVWASWSGIPARCWQWIDGQVFLGSDTGALYELTKDALSDSGAPITADMQLTWSLYDSSALKHFKMVSPYIITDGVPKPFVDIKVDYDDSAPSNQPDISLAGTGAIWDQATWDVDYWAQRPRAKTLWNGVSALGRVAAPRIKVSVNNCTFSLAGIDVVYEIGGVVG